MLLVITNSEDATANYLVSVLKHKNVPFLRLDTDTLTAGTELLYRPSAPAMRLNGRWYVPSDIDNVWYRRPEQLKSDRFGNSPDEKYILDEWAEAVEAFLAHIPTDKWMNHPSCNALASHKLEQLSTACSIGFDIPDTVVTQNDTTLRDFYQRHDGKIIVKPMASGYIERQAENVDSLIYTNPVCATDLDDLTDLALCPTLFQEFINKSSDVRITVVDDSCHAIELVAREADGRQRCDIRRNNMEDVEYRPIALPNAISKKVRQLMDHYELRFAAIDMIVETEGRWYFLEVNPNGQWAWLDLEAGTNIANSFVEAFCGETVTRIGMGR